MSEISPNRRRWLASTDAALWEIETLRLGHQPLPRELADHVLQLEVGTDSRRRTAPRTVTQAWERVMLVQAFILGCPFVLAREKAA